MLLALFPSLSEKECIVLWCCFAAFWLFWVLSDWWAGKSKEAITASLQRFACRRCCLVLRLRQGNIAYTLLGDDFLLKTFKILISIFAYFINSFSSYFILPFSSILFL